MGMLKPLGKGQGYLKAGILGFAKAGKTYTATEIAIGIRAQMGATAPIAFFDTEGGSEYVATRVRKETGVDLVGARSRSLDDLITIAREAEAGGASVLIVDSITHVWRELCDAYLVQKNERMEKAAKARNQKARRQWNLEFQDWNPIKATWARWTDWYLNSRIHVIICGRAGFEYAQELNQETEKKELVKTGTKMKVENEFGFEPSLLVEMERVPLSASEKTKKSTMVNRATVIGDRFGQLTGKSCDNPKYAFFRAHIDLLTPGVHAPIDMSVKTDLGMDEEGADPWAREKRQRTILCEEIVGVFGKLGLSGQSADAKEARMAKMEELFGTRSWTKISESTDSSILRAGLAKLQSAIADKGAADDSKELDGVFPSGAPAPAPEPAPAREPGVEG